MMPKMKTVRCVKILTLLLLGASVSSCQSNQDDSSLVKVTDSFNNASDYLNSDGGHKWRRRHSSRRNLNKYHEDFSEDLGDSGSRNWPHNNFIMHDSLQDGEQEIRIHFNGTLTKQISALRNGSGMVLRQITDGHELIQLIYSSSKYAYELLDCEYVVKKSTVKKFIDSFRKEIVTYDGSAYKKRRKPNCNSPEALSYSERRKCRNTFKRYANTLKSDIKEQLDEYDDERRIYDNLEVDEFHSLSENYSSLPLTDNYDTGRIKRRKKNKNLSLNSLRNVTIRILDSLAVLPDDLADLTDLDRSRDQCNTIHQKVYRRLQEERIDSISNTRMRRRRSQESLMILPGTLWCGVGHLAETYEKLGPLSYADSCCREHDHCPFIVKTLKYNYGVLNTNPYTISHCSCDRRRSRKVRSTVLFPGTKWCGKGNSGNHFEFGEFKAADRCCRLHDNACPFWVDAMSKKYGLFNYRPNTIMHCRCDERFRACLKMADTDASNMVGRLFFNIIQTKCFVLKPKKVCLERTRKGKCKKENYIKHAYLRHNPSY